MPETSHQVCPKCGCGREVCTWCRNVSERDWEALCDCGLHGFGRHLISCDIVRDDIAHSERAWADQLAVIREYEQP